MFLLLWKLWNSRKSHHKHFNENNNDFGADEKWQSEVVKYADDTAMIEKLNSRSDDKNLFQSSLNENDVDCIYMKTKFVVFEKRSVNHPNIVIGDHEISSCENYKYLGIHFDKNWTLKFTLVKSLGNLHARVEFFTN